MIKELRTAQLEKSTLSYLLFCSRIGTQLINKHLPPGGPTPLKNNGKLTTDITDECNVHNQQFQSVFTPKSPVVPDKVAGYG